MNEQKFEEEIEDEIESNEVGEKELTISQLKDIYSSSNFIKRLGELYEIYGTWAATAKNLSLEYKMNISPVRVREVYYKSFAKATSNKE